MTKTSKSPAGKSQGSVAVIGSGTMGAGIAQICATYGYQTILYDIDLEVVERAMDRMRKSLEQSVEKGRLDKGAPKQILKRIRPCTDLDDLDDDLMVVIEAAPESIELKRELFQKLDAVCGPDTILASNTSSFSITALGGATTRPERVAGLHFFNPAPIMKLVEVIAGKETKPEILEQLCKFAQSLNKTPVRAKDSPGFIVNRVARSFYGEALRLIDEGVADISQVDAIMRSEGGFKMGPFELMDLIGIDINYAVTLSVYEAYFQEPRFKPHPIQRQLVEGGQLGRKTGRGFYKYE